MESALHHIHANWAIGAKPGDISHAVLRQLRHPAIVEFKGVGAMRNESAEAMRRSMFLVQARPCSAASPADADRTALRLLFVSLVSGDMFGRYVVFRSPSRAVVISQVVSRKGMRQF